MAALSSLGLDYLENPNSYYSNAGGTKARKARSMVGRVAEEKALEELNSRLGTNMGSLDRASAESALANRFQSEVASDRFATGSGLYAGTGLYLGGRGLGLGLVGGERGMRRSAGSVGIGGTMMSGGAIIPALQSQPYGENFQFRKTLPPQFQMK